MTISILLVKKQLNKESTSPTHKLGNALSNATHLDYNQNMSGCAVPRPMTKLKG